MKRPHPGYAGISSYKRQRLIVDLENLSISDEPVQRPWHTSQASQPVVQMQKPIHDKVVPNVIKEQIWELLRQDGDIEGGLKGKLYRSVWEDMYKRNMQLTLWVDWRKQLFESWSQWYRCKLFELEAGDVEMELEDTDDEVYDEMDVDTELGDTAVDDNYGFYV